MPNFGYKCDECSHEFEEYVHTRDQANCNKVVPNDKRAICPKCGNIANRLMMGTRLYKYGGNLISMLADLKPVPDRKWDGKPSVDAGKNYGYVINLGPPQKQEDKPRYTILHFYECNCIFCKDI